MHLAHGILDIAFETIAVLENLKLDFQCIKQRLDVTTRDGIHRIIALIGHAA